MKGNLLKTPMPNKHNYHDNQGVRVVCRIRPPHRGEKYGFSLYLKLVIYRISDNTLEIPTGPVCNIQDK